MVTKVFSLILLGIVHLASARYYDAPPAPITHCPTTQVVEYSTVTVTATKVTTVPGDLAVSHYDVNEVTEVKTVSVTEYLPETIYAEPQVVDYTSLVFVESVVPISVTDVHTITSTVVSTEINTITSTATNYITSTNVVESTSTFYKTSTDLTTKFVVQTESIVVPDPYTNTATITHMETTTVIVTVTGEPVLKTTTLSTTVHPTTVHSITKLVTETVCPLPMYA